LESPIETHRSSKKLISELVLTHPFQKPIVLVNLDALADSDQIEIGPMLVEAQEVARLVGYSTQMTRENATALVNQLAGADVSALFELVVGSDELDRAPGVNAADPVIAVVKKKLGERVLEPHFGVLAGSHQEAEDFLRRSAFVDEFSLEGIASTIENARTAGQKKVEVSFMHLQIAGLVAHILDAQGQAVSAQALDLRSNNWTQTIWMNTRGAQILQSACADKVRQVRQAAQYEQAA
jgi:hypothetical protein